MKNLPVAQKSVMVAFMHNASPCISAGPPAGSRTSNFSSGTASRGTDATSTTVTSAVGEEDAGPGPRTGCGHKYEAIAMRIPATGAHAVFC